MPYYSILTLLLLSIIFLNAALALEINEDDQRAINRRRVDLQEQLLKMTKDELIQFSMMMMEANMAKEVKLQDARDKSDDSSDNPPASSPVGGIRTYSESSIVKNAKESDAFLWNTALVEYVFEEERTRAIGNSKRRRLFVFNAFSGLVKAAINRVLGGRKQKLVNLIVGVVANYADTLLYAAYPILLLIGPIIGIPLKGFLDGILPGSGSKPDTGGNPKDPEDPMDGFIPRSNNSTF